MMADFQSDDGAPILHGKATHARSLAVAAHDDALLGGAELRGLAVEYRKMATVAREAFQARALRELAGRYERMAGEREASKTLGRS